MKGTISIIGYIGKLQEEEKTFYGGNTTMVDVVTQVKRQPEATSFNVIIDSPGGSVQTGWDIYNYLLSLGVPIQTYGSGMVASIASVIFMAGTTRTITDNTKFMVHLPMGSIANANTDQMKEYTAELQKVEDDMVKFYTNSLGVSKEAILPILREETYLNYTQLKELGFVTEESPMLISACATINHEKMNKKETETLFGELMNFLKGVKKAEAKNLIVYTATQLEVDFYELGEDAEVVLGAKARIDGQPAEGDIAMADGKIYVFSAGELVQIKEDLEDDNVEEMLKELETAKQELDIANAKVVDLTGEKDELEKELTEAKALLGKFQKLESKFIALAGKESSGHGKQEPKKENRFRAALNNIQKN